MNYIWFGLIIFVVIAIVTPYWIAYLKRKKWTQPIRKELPDDHQKKKGTPLMLGAVFMLAALVVCIFHPSWIMLLITATFFSFGYIGFKDDFWKASRQDPGGISSRTKLKFQAIFSSLIVIWLTFGLGVTTDVYIGSSFHFEMPWILFFIIIVLFMMGTSNAINFTDGMDGLLAVVAIPSYLFFFIISSHEGVKWFSVAMIAALLAFLIYNKYPSKGFMGDTGSLAIGGSLTIMSVIEQVEWLIPILFIIYFAEIGSVMIQVAVFKRTGKRVFKMSPIHYHYALKYGWNEKKIVAIFGLTSLCAAALSLLLYYIT